MQIRKSLLWTFACIWSVSCAAGSDADDAKAKDDAAADEGDAESLPELNGCKAADYVDRSAPDADRSIAIAASGLTFTPKCMIIAPGQRVTWQGSLSAHPLAPGNPDDAAAGSADNPIVDTSSGREVTFTFAASGAFPYYCTLHAFGAGQGMAGTVVVR